MAFLCALGTLTFRANSNKYHCRLDLQGELVFVYQHRLSGVLTSAGALRWRGRGTGASA